MTAQRPADPATAPPGGELGSWRPGPARQAVLDFVARATGVDGDPPVPPDERVAVFDNDGTLWCEKPMPIQLDFILRRLVEMVEADPALADRQPWKAAREKDAAWLGAVLTDHYAGDDGKAQELAGGILAAYAGMSVEEFEQRSETFLRSASNPGLRRGYLRTAYRPMVELLDLLAANGFTTYIASGGGRDFMRPVTRRALRHPAGAGDRELQHARVRRRHDHAHARTRVPRRRSAEADPHLEPGRPPAAARGWQQRRGRRHAGLHPAGRPAVPAAARAARRRGPGVRLHRGRREVPRASRARRHRPW